MNDRFRSGVAWNVAGLLVAGSAGLVLNTLIGNIYGPEGLGAFNQVFALYIFASQFAVLGMHQSALKRVAERADDKAQVAVVTASALLATLPFAVVVGFALYAAAGPAGRILDSELVTVGTRWVAPGVALFALNKVLLGVLNGLDRMRAYAVLQSGRFVLMLGAFSGCVWLDRGIGDLPIILTAGEAGTLLCALVAARNEVWAKPSAAWIKDHLAFGARGFMGGVFVELNTRVDLLLLGYFASDTLVGLYSFAAIFAEAFLQLLIVLRQSYSPIVVRLWATGAKDELCALIRRGRTRTYLGTALLALIALLVYRFGFPLVMTDPRLAESWPIFAILLGGIVLTAGYTPFNQLPIQTGHPGWQTVMLTATVALNAIGNVILIPIWGAEGSAIATSFAAVAQVAILLVLARSVLALRI